MKRTPIFDTVRRMIGRGFHRHEVDTLNRAIDRAVGTPADCSQDGGSSGQCFPPDRIGEQGIALIKRFEGCARLRNDGLVEAYPDPGTGGDPWTIGWGATGPGIGPGVTWTRAECDARLERDLRHYAEEVAQALGNAPTTQTQFDALVSFHYNTGAIARATLTKHHRAGDYDAAVREFARWNKAGGRVLKGLIRRRTAEAELYTSRQ